MEIRRYNIFQRLTRQWDSLHPYNAAQAVRLAGEPDLDALASHWRSLLRELGLGCTRPGAKSYRWEPIETAVPAGCDPVFIDSQQQPLEQFMTHELNLPFDLKSGFPFRAYVIRVDSSSYFLSIVYHHWVADSYSIRVMLREWFLRVVDPIRARRSPMRLASDGYWKLFGPAAAGWSIDTAFWGMTRWTAQFRRARRIDPKGLNDLGVQFTLHHAPPNLITGVAARAKSLGVTVNDVFLAAMAEICNLRVVEPRNRRRRDLALGTIVDLRSKADDRKMNETFGLYLGFTTVFCRGDDLTDWNRLLARVHRQNDAQKRSAGAESSMLRMVAGLVFARLFSRKNLLEFYRKRYPITGGISNVNLNRDWPAEYHPWPLLEYVRVSPCGPMLPVVFTPTTLGQQLNFGLTCRDSLIASEQSAELAAMFIRRLEWFASAQVHDIIGAESQKAAIRAFGG